MLFNSFAFLIFFIVVFTANWLLKSSYRKQNILLLSASYLFYGWWDIRFLFLVTVSTYIDYYTTLMIDSGKVTTKQQVRSAAYLIGAAFLFVSCRWNVWDRSLEGIVAILPRTFNDWWVTLFAVGFVLFFIAIRVLPEKVGIVQSNKFYLFWSVTTNLSILGLFKYFNFFTDSFISLWDWLFHNAPSEVTLRIALPVGISFYTFQTMSHTIDVYRKKIPATDSLLDLATYVAFFPQILSGPIERGARMLPQFQRARTTLTWDDFRSGTWLVFWGLYKKMVIADNLSQIVNRVFEPYDLQRIMDVPNDGLRCLVAIYAFTIQIYCDFSGYTDIARGIARLLGFDIMLNFNLPYFALNPSAFWQRWHISLSTWLRDYLYIPLGGNRGSKTATLRNLMITMVLGGLWHGAAWTFVLWGAFHGIILVIYRFFGDSSGGPKRLTVVNFGRGLILFHLVCFGWLMFRAHHLGTVGVFTAAIFTSLKSSPESVSLAGDLLFYSWFLFAFQCAQAWTGRLEPLAKWHWFIRLNIWIFILLSLFRLAPMESQQFIYFAF